MEFNQTLTPAYGRDYNSEGEVLSAIAAGKDWICPLSGQYTSVVELKQMGYSAAWIRYRKLTRKMRITL